MENIITINYQNYKYLSDVVLDDGRKFELPNGILDKGMTGCGGTTLALVDRHKNIVCSPRIALLKNKAAQHEGSLLVIGGVGENAIKEYLGKTEIPKILVTFDSLSRVLDCIGDMSDWRVVVDEFQCLLTDATFKSEVEMRVLEDLAERCPYVTYLSATPIDRKYLDMIEQLKDVDYYTIKWENAPKIKVNTHLANNTLNAVSKIIERYKKGLYPTAIIGENELVESKELVVFVNSVTAIVNLIKNNKLKAEEVNIVVADNEKNQEFVKNLGDDYSIGHPPLRDEPRKKFTFCTSTAFMGVDFYSDCATTVLVSDTDNQAACIDLNIQLLQVAGRQRLESNPFGREVFFIFNVTNQVPDEDKFKEVISKKEELCNRIINIYNNEKSDVMKEWFIRQVMRDMRTLNYSVSFVFYDDNNKVFKFNDMAMVAEQYMFEISHKQYENSALVLKAIDEQDSLEACGDNKLHHYKKYFVSTLKNSWFSDNMKMYTDERRRLEAEGKSGSLLLSVISKRDKSFSSFYESLSYEDITSCNYDEYAMKERCKRCAEDKKVRDAFGEELKRKKKIRMSNAELKELINSLAVQVGVERHYTASFITSDEKWGGVKSELTDNGRRVYYYTFEHKPTSKCFFMYGISKIFRLLQKWA